MDMKNRYVDSPGNPLGREEKGPIERTIEIGQRTAAQKPNKRGFAFVFSVLRWDLGVSLCSPG